LTVCFQSWIRSQHSSAAAASATCTDDEVIRGGNPEIRADYLQANRQHISGFGRATTWSCSGRACAGSFICLNGRGAFTAAAARWTDGQIDTDAALERR